LAVVTDPPILINNATDRGTAPFSGPFEIGSALYLVSNETTPTPGIHVWKSLDSGATWTLQDSANQPTTDGDSYDVTLIGTVFFIAVQNIVINPNENLQMITFDTATDTYGALVDSGRTVALGANVRMAALSDLSLVIVYQKPDTSIKFTTFAAGVFGAEVAFAAAASQAPRAIVIDLSDVAHVFWSKTVTGTTTLNHTTITAGVVSAPQAVHANTNSVFVTSKSPAVIWGDKLVFPSRTDIAATAAAGVWIGTPIAAPVWSFELVDDIDWPGLGFPGESDVLPFVFLGGDGLLYVFWTALDYDDIANIIDREYYKTNDGSGWSDPILFYDAVTDPQTADPVAPEDQFIHVTNFTLLSDNTTIGAFIALETPTFCAPFYLIPTPCDPVVTVNGIVVPNNGEPFALPPGVEGQPYGPVQIVFSEGPSESWEYSIPVGNLPPGLTMGPGTPSNPAPTTTTEVGVPIQGTPTFTSFSGPVTTFFTMRGRLIG